MSYDLMVHRTGGPVTTRDLRALPYADAFEIFQSGPDVTIAMSGDDSEIATFVHHLLGWAAGHDAAVHDPQLGEPLERLSQITWLRPTPKGKTLPTRLKHLVRGGLDRHGFWFEKPRTLIRERMHLTQGLEFLPPRPHRQSVTVFWRILLGPVWVEGGYTGTVRLDQLAPRERDTSQDLFAQAIADVLDYALPYLDRFDTIDKILAGVDSEVLPVSQAFGPSDDWQHYYRGLCLHHVGRVDEAIETMTALVSQHSLHPLLAHAQRMRIEGKPHFAAQAEADYAKVRAKGVPMIERRKAWAFEQLEQWRGER